MFLENISPPKHILNLALGFGILLFVFQILYFSWPSRRLLPLARLPPPARLLQPIGRVAPHWCPMG